MAVKIMLLSFKAIWNNKMRSFLTMLGIIIGVAAVVVLVSITQGATSGITDSISSMGSNQITASITSDDVSVSAEDLQELESYSTISGIAPVISTNKSVKHNGNTGSYSVTGVTEDYFEVQDVTIQSGRLLAFSDMEWATNVAIIGTEVASDLFETWDAVGGTVTIGDRTYTVVGVLEEQGSSLVGSDDNRILIPYTTAERMTGQKSVSTFYVQASSDNAVTMAMNTIEAYLLQLTRDEDAYTVSNQSDILDTMDDVTNTMSLLLAGIAGISLLVGGIGIMNIMLVSVTERTREIGIRKAVGAKRRHIMMQFLCESCVLSILGGLIGLGISFAAVSVYGAVSASGASINWGIGLAALAFCAVIGVLFGSYPAAKASRLQPIEALHSV